MVIRGKEFDFINDVYIMGILNVTPDSFSDGGEHNEESQAIARAAEMIEEGVDIIDIGGESTRPGFEYVSCEEEIKRVIPVVQNLRKLYPNVIISIDTTKASVAKEAILAGADIINDVSGFLLDENMAETCRNLDVPVVLMHDSTYFTDGEKTGNIIYNSYIEKLINELEYICNNAMNHGIRRENIIVDPGVGFGKRLEENLMAIRDLGQVCELGFPILLGCSRKSVIGLSLDLPVTDRKEGTITTSVYGAMNGAGILRVHDVMENVRAINMLKSIRNITKNPSK